MGNKQSSKEIKEIKETDNYKKYENPKIDNTQSPQHGFAQYTTTYNTPIVYPQISSTTNTSKLDINNVQKYENPIILQPLTQNSYNQYNEPIYQHIAHASAPPIDDNIYYFNQYNNK